MDVCPHDAIKLSDEGVAIAAGKCRNCALCTAACPTAALMPSNLPRISLLAKAVQRVRFDIACASAGLPGDAVVPCLGALDATTLAYLGKRCIEVTLAGASHCHRCEHGRTGAAALARHVAVRDILAESCAGEIWETLTLLDNEGAPTKHTPQQTRAPSAVGCRERFQGRKALQAPLELLVINTAIRPGPRHLPKTRELLQIVSRRANNEDCRLPALSDLPVAEMRLTSGCRNCGACVAACPTGALRIRETETTRALQFLVDLCVGCGVCAEACEPAALQPAEVMDITPGRAGLVLNGISRQPAAADAVVGD
jgi:ferredoxin